MQSGYPLVRAFLPTQELEPEQATVFMLALRWLHKN